MKGWRAITYLWDYKIAIEDLKARKISKIIHFYIFILLVLNPYLTFFDGEQFKLFSAKPLEAISKLLILGGGLLACFNFYKKASTSLSFLELFGSFYVFGYIRLLIFNLILLGLVLLLPIVFFGFDYSKNEYFNSTLVYFSSVVEVGSIMIFILWEIFCFRYFLKCK